MKKLLLIYLALGFVGVFSVGCPVWEAAVEDISGDNTNTVTSQTTTTAISVTPTNSTITNGSTTSFSASGATTPLTWTTSDDTLGSIDSSSGVFTASESNSGTSTITVTDASGNTGTTTVIVS